MECGKTVTLDMKSEGHSVHSFRFCNFRILLLNILELSRDEPCLKTDLSTHITAFINILGMHMAQARKTSLQSFGKLEHLLNRTLHPLPPRSFPFRASPRSFTSGKTCKMLEYFCKDVKTWISESGSYKNAIPTCRHGLYKNLACKERPVASPVRKIRS